MNRVLFLVVGTGLLLASSGVRAQEAEDLEARRLFEAGEVAFRGGNYDRALERFREAYELSQRPELLYNIASTAERLRRDDEALAAYRDYLEALPSAENRSEVEARIAILERSLAEGEPSAAAEDDPAVADVGEPVDEGGIRVSTWLLGTTTVLATILGVTGRLLGNAEYDDLYEDCLARGGCTDDEVEASRVERWDRVTVASFVVAGAALVGTVLSLVLRPSADAEDEPELSLQVGPQQLLLRGRF